MNLNFYTHLAPKHNNSSSIKIIGHIAALITIIMWGFSFISTKILLDFGMGPVEIYIYRFVIAYLLMLAIYHKRFKSHSWRDEVLFILCALCGSSLYFIAENTALEYTLASNVSLLTSLSPIFTAILTGMFFANEKPGRGMYIGSSIAFIGVACVIFNSSTNLEVHPFGDILSIFAAIGWAIYSLLIRRLSANYDVGFITRRIFFYGLITSLPFLILSPSLANPIDIFTNFIPLINLLFLAVGASMLGFLLWAFSVKEIGAITTGNYMYLQPVITMIASVIVLHDNLSVLGIIGCTLILAGLWLGEKLNQ
ncbi:MAG: DMT family transporter [Muribaculaceae bacterium]|nr:DMT family transporter [Muribaculaceae bacterium]